MKDILYTAEQELTVLNNQIAALTKHLPDFPDGTLSISSSHNHVQYHHCFINSQNIRVRQYINRKNIDSARDLSQKGYEIDLLDKSKARRESLIQLIDCYKQNDLTSPYYNAHEQRRALIHPYFISDEDYAIQWQTVEYERKPFAENAPVFITLKGERVRSKSEKIIADTLASLDIPYRYEFPFTTVNCSTLHPDFLILNKRTREEIYLEHLGKMDDASYVNDNMNRIYQLTSSGLVFGHNLLFTFESKTKPLNTKILTTLLETHFL